MLTLGVLREERLWEGRSNVGLAVKSPASCRGVGLREERSAQPWYSAECKSNVGRAVKPNTWNMGTGIKLKMLRGGGALFWDSRLWHVATRGYRLTI
jgi:hypothetical protein